MRQLLLLAAMAASVHVSAQKFTPQGGGTCGVNYGWPCPFSSIPTGYSYSDYGSGTYYLDDPLPMDVHGPDGSTRNEIYTVGIEAAASPDRAYFMRRNATTGQITQLITWGPLTPGGTDAGNAAVTYDNNNDRLFVLGAYFIPGGTQVYFRRFNYTTNSFLFTCYLPTTIALSALDMAVDGNGDVYILCGKIGTSGFMIYKYTFNGTTLGSLNSTSISGLSTPYAKKFEYDNNTGNLYICGRDGSAGFICGINASLSVLGVGTDANSTWGYTDIDFDNNGYLFAVGSDGNYPSWAEWDVSTYTTNYTGTSSTMANISEILIDPNDRHIVLADQYITYIDLAAGDIHYGSDVGTLPTTVSPQYSKLHRDATDGDILVCGLNPSTFPVYPTEYVARYNYTGGPTSWSGYENKSTTSVSSLDKDNSIVLHPNPTTNRLSIDLKNNNADNYRIINNMGQMVSKGYMLAPRATIDVSMLQPGQYYLQLLNNTQTINTQTFTKQ